MILDTNALSAVADNEPAAALLFRRAATIELPVITLGEYRFGLADSRHREEYEEWLDALVVAARVLPVDATTSEYYAEIRSELRRAGRPIPSNDLWIAALSRQHRLALMTQDRHFDAVRGLERIEW